jgi:ribosomal-protein-alanine N-acetyltransferase
VIERFETERLQGWRPTEASGSLLEAIFGDPDAAATLGGVRDAAGARAILLRFLSHWTSHGYGPWIIAERASGWPLGYCGLQNLTDGGRGVELLYAFLPEAWGRGYATEAALAVVHLAFADLELTELVASTLTTNLPSRTVIERCGFQFEREGERAGLPHAFYRLRSIDWGADRGR